MDPNSNSNPFIPNHHDSSSNEIPLTDQFALGVENPSLGLPELPLVGTTEPSLGNWVFPQIPPSSSSGVDNLLPNDPLHDQFISDLLNENGGDLPENSFEGGSDSGTGGGESFFLENDNFKKFPENSKFGNPVKISNWPVPPSPYICSCCQVLREIIHTNGKQIRKFEIHGRLGMFSHAILDKFEIGLPSENHEFHIFDFCNESTGNVKDFLVEYCEGLKRKDYHMIKDPFSKFYQALSVGINDNDNIASDHVFQSSTFSGQRDAENSGIGLATSDSGAGSSRPNFAAQRERAGKMKLQDFAEFYDLRISDVAKKMNVCPSVIKKKCREAGLTRWPYRKVNGIKKKIMEKKRSLSACPPSERPRLLMEIQMLEQELEDIFAAIMRSLNG